MRYDEWRRVLLDILIFARKLYTIISKAPTMMSDRAYPYPFEGCFCRHFDGDGDELSEGCVFSAVAEFKEEKRKRGLR